MTEYPLFLVFSFVSVSSTQSVACRGGGTCSGVGGGGHRSKRALDI